MVPVIQYIWLAIVLLYCVGMILFFTGLYFPNRKRHAGKSSVTVIVAARNEESAIGNLISDLMKQNYPAESFEVIIADDHSTDRTAEVVKNSIQSDPRFHLIRVKTKENGLTAKKNAIYQALKQSRGEIILSVDADCRVKPTWIETMISYFTPETGMVVGFSQLGQRGTCCNL